MLSLMKELPIICQDVVKWIKGNNQLIICHWLVSRESKFPAPIIGDEYGTGRREDSLLAVLPAAASRSMRLAFSPHAVH